MSSIVSLVLALILFVPLPVHAEGSYWSDLAAYLHTNFPTSYRQLGRIEQMQGTRFVFSIKGKAPARGRELLVLKKLKGVSTLLLPQAAVARVESVMGQKVLCQQMALLGKAPGVGDLVVVPSAPVVYLYTNIRGKESFPPYQRLLKNLLSENLEVMELIEPTITPRTDRYGILVRLEGSEGHLTVRVQSVYSQDTLFFRTTAYAGKFRLQAPIGKPVLLASAAAAPAAPAFKAPAQAAPAPAAPAPAVQRKPPKTSFTQAAPVPVKDYYRLPEKYQRMVICDLNGDGIYEFVLLNNKSVTAYRIQGGRLVKFTGWELPGSSYVGLHLHALDINGDGGDELMVTLGKKVSAYEGDLDTILSSAVLTLKEGRLKVLQAKLPYYLRVIEDRSGRRVLLGQKKGEKELYSGDILELRWDAGKGRLRSAGEFEPAHDVYSVYQFNLPPDDPDHVAILEPSDFLHVYYIATETVEAISDKNYGSYTEIPFPVRPTSEQYMGGFTKKTHELAYAPRRFVLKTEFDDQMFTIQKGRSKISITTSLGSPLPAGQGQDRLVALKWINGRIDETWKTEGLDKSILDFAFYAKPANERLYVLVRDSQGCTIERVD